MSTTTMDAGKQILDIITSGMYSNSLMVLREYIQNASDSIDDAVSIGLIDHKSSRINIEIDGENREISIIDNGIGVPSSRVGSILAGIARSSKGNRSSRGFRGIGRLGGVGYSDQVVFETRSTKDEDISKALWNGKLLRDECRDVSHNLDLSATIKKVVRVEKCSPARKDLVHFFRITMKGVHRFHRDDLMNIEVIRNYLSQVAPLPFDKGTFSYYEKINKYLSDIEGYKTYNIFLNGEKLFKPHHDTFAISGQNKDKITGLHLFDIKGRTGESIGRGWFAKCGYKASLPQSERMRGIHLKQGNIEIGDEYFLADYFTERRFSTWHIGEIHFHYNLRLNARRDGFEQSPEYECFIEQAILLCRHLSNLCRNASKMRSRQLNIEKTLESTKESIETAIFSCHEVRKEAIEKARKLLSVPAIGNNEQDSEVKHNKRIFALQNKLTQVENDAICLVNLLDGRLLRGIDKKELVQDISTRIITNYGKHSSSVDFVKKILGPYLRRSCAP